MHKKNEMSLNRKDIQIKYCKIVEIIPLIKHLLHYGNQNPLVYFTVCKPPYVYAPSNLEIKNHQYEIFIYYSIFALKVNLNRLFVPLITETVSHFYISSFVRILFVGSIKISKFVTSNFKFSSRIFQMYAQISQ